MIRGTSHTVSFDCLDIIDNVDNVEEAEITFNQEDNDKMPLIKFYSDSGCIIDVDTKTIFVELTPQETLMFTDKRKLKVQLRIKMLDLYGNSYILGNYIQTITVYPTLSESLLEGGGVSG